MLLACGGSTGSGSPRTSSNGTPDLSGETISFAIGSDPTVSDTTSYLVVRQLRAWGARVNLINLTGDPDAVRTVLSGQADVGFVAVSSIINASLVAFGPNQPRVDYFMVGGRDLSSTSHLAGHTFAVSNTRGIEALMLRAELDKHRISLGKVSTIISGSSSARVQALAAGKVDATFAHFDGWIQLKPQGFHLLATVADDLPQLADSYMAATRSWLNSNPRLAQAVDEAWIHAAQEFETDPKAWADAAQAYTNHAQPDSFVSQAYQTLKAAQVWPDDGSGFSIKDAQYNEGVANQTGAITSNPEAKTWIDVAPWDRAVQARLHKQAV
jgi:ABC-type nitrate/sulfonate/bicarbonate transport system substrate-binding protein